MNKSDFTVELYEKLSSIPFKEIDERLSFYIEIIDDKIDEGISEDEAVASVGSVDEIVKEINDNPTIGLLLCRHKNNVTAEYTLRDMNKPMGVSEYRIKDYLPENLQKELPSIEELINIVKQEI